MSQLLDLCSVCSKAGHTPDKCIFKILGPCDRCGRMGHKTEKCRSDVKRSADETKVMMICNNCKEPGHIGKFCRKPQTCHICKETGHIATVCPNVKCHKCHRAGHFANQCRQTGIIPPLVKKAVSSPDGKIQTLVDRIKQEVLREMNLDELKKDAKAKDDDDDNTCIICLNAPRDYILLPCAHLKYCGPCAAAITECSECKSYIKERKRVFH